MDFSVATRVLHAVRNGREYGIYLDQASVERAIRAVQHGIREAEFRPGKPRATRLAAAAIQEGRRVTLAPILVIDFYEGSA